MAKPPIIEFEETLPRRIQTRVMRAFTSDENLSQARRAAQDEIDLTLRLYDEYSSRIQNGKSTGAKADIGQEGIVPLDTSEILDYMYQLKMTEIAQYAGRVGLNLSELDFTPIDERVTADDVRQ